MDALADNIKTMVTPITMMVVSELGQCTVGAVNEGVNELQARGITPPQPRRGGRDTKKISRSSFKRADGVVLVNG